MRTIGPFADLVTAMAVDSQGSLYVAFDSQGPITSYVFVYDSSANGNPASLRTIYPNPPTSSIRALAVDG